MVSLEFVELQAVPFLAATFSSANYCAAFSAASCPAAGLRRRSATGKRQSKCRIQRLGNASAFLKAHKNYNKNQLNDSNASEQSVINLILCGEPAEKSESQFGSDWQALLANG